ncbi:MAG TPA: MMPL family transporter [Candidatus Dormibacteraeota bacterium]|nr:MMPL family transporter [Candidatus Dormibacteraeota bacterium]
MRFLSNLAGLPAGRITKWVVVVAWLMLGVVVGPLARQLPHVERNDASAFAPRGAESTKTRDLLARTPAGQELLAVVVYARKSGLTAADRARAARDRRQLAGIATGERVESPIESADGQALLLSVPIDGSDANVAYSATRRIRDEVTSAAPAGLTVKVTGPAAFVVDGADAFLDVDLKLLLLTVGVVAVLLLLIYRSPILWLLPLLTAMLANGIAQGVVYILVKAAGLTVNGLSSGVLTVLVFGASTDYALLLVARYREELRHHADRHTAMRAAMRRAVPAIVASAATVGLGLLCLLAADMSSNRSLGPVGAVGILCALAAMTILLPALLVSFGSWLFWPWVPRYGATRPRRSPWASVARVVARRPRAVWLAAAALLVVCAAALPGVRTGLAGDATYTTAPESVVGQRLLAAHFAGGASAPADIAARGAAAPAVVAAVAATSGVAQVLPATQVGDLVRVRAVLADPPDSAPAERTIERLRAAVHDLPGATVLVGGYTATQLDTANATRHDRTLVIPAVLALIVLVLALLLRSLVAPALLVATVVLSFSAALGACWLTFHYVIGFPALDDQALLLGFVFLVALGVDYNIFLVTRVREEVRALGDHRAGVLRGLTATGGVITGAGVVLAATFALLTIFPLVFAVEFGLLVAVGVLLDTIVVRALLVPALALDVGRSIWWPSRLAQEKPSWPSRIAGGTLCWSDGARRKPVEKSGAKGWQAPPPILPP